MKTQRQFSRWLIPLLLMVLAIVACNILSGAGDSGDDAPDAEEQVAVEDEPTDETGADTNDSSAASDETAEPDGAADPGASAGRYTDMYDFQTALLDALTAPPRDYGYLQHGFMGAEFAFADLFSIDPQDATTAIANMQSYHLPPGNFLTFDLSADPAAKLGQAPPPAAYTLYTYGWGPKSDMGGILLVDFDAEGYLYWSGVITFYEDGAGLPPAGSDPIWGLKQALILALEPPRNYDNLKEFMGETFDVWHWNGGNEPLSPPEAVNALYGGYLPVGNALTFNDGVDFNTLIGDSPYLLYPMYADFLYASGWGMDGKDEAIILIGQKDDGSFYWAGLLYAHGGFGGGPTANPWMPLPEAFCDDLKSSMETAIGAGTLTYDGSAPFSDHVGGGSGTGCLITITGDGNDFDGWYGHLENLIAMMKSKSWTEDTHYMAAGPTGQGTGFRRDEGLAIIMTGWEPTTTDHCPADQPIGACAFTPEQQIYTFTLHAAMQ